MPYFTEFRSPEHCEPTTMLFELDVVSFKDVIAEVFVHTPE